MRPDNMSIIALQCEKLIQARRTDNMQTKLDTFMLTERLTIEEYTYLSGLLSVD